MFYDQSILVRDSINGVVESILIGLLLSVAVLMGFLKNWRTERTEKQLNDGGKARTVTYTDPATGVRYHWTAPAFEAPLGKYGWLNDAVFISALSGAGDKEHPAVRITIYRIGE